MSKSEGATEAPCPIPIPITYESFKTIVEKQRDAILKQYVADREAFMDQTLGSTTEGRKGRTQQEIDRDFQTIHKADSSLSSSDPFRASWLPKKATFPKFPPREFAFAARMTGSTEDPVDEALHPLEPTEGVKLREYMEDGHRLLLLTFDEMMETSYMDSLIFRFALTRHFDYESAAPRFLKFRKLLSDYKVVWEPDEEVATVLKLGAFNIPPSYAASLLDPHSTLLAEAQDESSGLRRRTPHRPEGSKTAFDPVKRVDDDGNKIYERRHPRTPLLIVRPRFIDWEKLSTPTVIKGWFYFFMSVLSSDYFIQTNGYLFINSLKKTGVTAMNKEFRTFITTATQQCLPVKTIKTFLVNEGFFVHNVVWPIMKLALSTKMISKIQFVGKDYEIVTREIDPKIVAAEAGGEVNLPDHSEPTHQFVELVCDVNRLRDVTVDPASPGAIVVDEGTSQ